MSIRTHISKQVIAIAALLFAFGLSSCGEVSLNDPMLGKELVHTIFYVKRSGSGPGASSQILRINADGTKPMVIADNAFITSAPKNGKVVYITPLYINPIPGNYKDSTYVILCDADGSNKVKIDSGVYIAAELSPKADFVLLTTGDCQLAGPAKAQPKLLRVNINGSKIDTPVEYKLSPVPARLEINHLPILSPDGKKAAFVTDKGKHGLNFVDTKPGFTGTPLPDIDIPQDDRISWSANGISILSIGDQAKKLDVTELSGSQRHIFGPGWKVEDAMFSPINDTILAVISIYGSPAKLNELSSIPSDTPTTLSSTPGKFINLGGYSNDCNYIVYSSQPPQFAPRAMTIYDRFLQKDTVLDTGVYECFFAK